MPALLFRYRPNNSPSAKHDQVIDTLTKMGASQPLERIEREWAGAC